MEYAKYISEYAIQPAPKMVRIGRKRIMNPRPEILVELGYKPVVEDDRPETTGTQYLVPRYTDLVEDIGRHWEIRDTGGGE